MAKTLAREGRVLVANVQELVRLLDRLGVQHGHLDDELKSGRVYSDHHRVVIKLFPPRLADEIVKNITDMDDAGFTCEKFLVPGFQDIPDSYDVALILGYEHSQWEDERAAAARANDPILVERYEAHVLDYSDRVGLILRQVYDNLLIPNAEPDEVYQPADWAPRNFVVTAHGPVIVDWDFYGSGKRDRCVDLAIGDFVGRATYMGRDAFRVKADFLQGYNHDGKFTGADWFEEIRKRLPRT